MVSFKNIVIFGFAFGLSAAYIYIFIKYIKTAKQNLQFKIWVLLMLALLLFLIETIIYNHDIWGFYYLMFVWSDMVFVYAHWVYCWGIYVRSFQIQEILQLNLPSLSE
jgi:hypothetical protein